MAELTAQEWEECQEIFNLLDRDQSGYLDFTELGRGLRGLGLNPTQLEVQQYMDEFDTDHSNGLSVEEFAYLYKRSLSNSSITEEEVRAQFEKLDKNGDGSIDANELREILTTGEEPLTLDEAEAIIADFDKNGDGVLSLQEFMHALIGKH